MPIVTVKLLAGAFTAQQKHDLITDMTEAVVRMGGEGIRPSVQVLVEEVESGLWGVGGKRLTIEEIEARRVSRAAAERR